MANLSNINNKFLVTTGGNVGIGTTSPAEKLEVAGSIKSTSRAIAGGSTAGITLSYDTSNSIGLIETWTSKPIGIETAGVRRMTIDSSGNVGIGITNPSDYYSTANDLVVGGSSHHGITIVTGNANTGAIHFADGTSGTAEYAGYVAYQHDGDKLRFGVNASDKLVIQSSGNVIIGTGVINPSIGGDIAITQGNIGLRLNDAASAISPTTATANNSGVVDLGVSNIRFKNLYLTENMFAGRYLNLLDSDYTYIKGIRTSPSDGDYLTRLMGYGDSTFYGSFDVLKHDANDGELKMRQLVAGTVTDVMTIVDGNVGIGNTSPSGKLHVGSGSSALISGSADELILDGSGNSGMTIGSGTSGVGSIFFADSDANASGYVQYAHSNNTLYFGTVGTERMRITSNNEGHFEFDGTAPLIKATASNGSSGLRINIAGQTTGQLLRVQEDGATKFQINENGNVGIGTTAPAANLEVIDPVSGNFSGEIRVGGSGSTRRLLLKQDTVLEYLIGAFGSDALLKFGTGTGAAEKMRITSGGDVGISTISAAETNEGLWLYAQGIYLSKKAGTGIGTHCIFQNNAGVTPTTVGTIKSSGSSTSYNTSSDYRLKENVVEMTGALDRVSQLKPSRFNFISDADTTVDGFLAHEVQEIVPEAISGQKDAVDKEGNPEYQGIDQSKLVPLLVGAIQELKAEIDELKK